MNILFFHGFSSHPDSLQKIVTCLAKDGHQVTTPFMASFSLHNGKHSSIQEWYEEAEKEFYDFALSARGDICLAGHSLGGAVCAHLLSKDTLKEEFTRRISKCAFLASPAGIDDEFLAFFRNSSSAGIDWPFSLQAQMFSFLRSTDLIYDKISIPSIVLQGGRDSHIPPSSGAVLAQRLGKYCHKLCTHPEADHFFPNGSSAGANHLQKKLAAFLKHEEKTRP